MVGYVQRLLASHLPEGDEQGTLREQWVRTAFERLEYSFTHVNRKYYRAEGTTRFDHLNADHMASFLWFLGNTAWQESGDEGIAVRLSYLNRIMHGIDLFYSVPMPDIFVLVHPIGTVIGRGTFGDYLVVYQQVTVGASESGGNFPALGEGVALFAGSTVIGDCVVGDDVVFAARSMIIGTNVPSNSVVVGQYPNQRMLASRSSVRRRCFD
jgi:serine O-acetyltransferase